MRIELRDVCFSYGKGAAGGAVLDHVSFAVRDGDFLGIVGRTGSGKSTLVQHLNGLLKPESGRVFVGGKEVGSEIPGRLVRRAVGVVFQFPENQLFGETVLEDVSFGPRNLGYDAEAVRVRVEKALELVGLNLRELGGRSPLSLSGGEMRKVALAGVLAMRPEVLVLDEPTAGLDGPGRRDILAHLEFLHAQEGQTIVLVSHDADEIASLATRLIVLDEGRVVSDGAPHEIFGGPGTRLPAGLNRPSNIELAAALRAKGLPVAGPHLKTEETVSAIVGALAQPSRERS